MESLQSPILHRCTGRACTDLVCWLLALPLPAVKFCSPQQNLHAQLVYESEIPLHVCKALPHVFARSWRVCVPGHVELQLSRQVSAPCRAEQSVPSGVR